MKIFSVLSLAALFAFSVLRAESIDLNSADGYTIDLSDTQSAVTHTQTRFFYKHAFEMGLGYVYSTFAAKQSLSNILPLRDTTGKAHGADLFLGWNGYISRPFGISASMGTEFMSIAWDEALYDYDQYNFRGGYGTSALDEVKKDTAATLYGKFGVFYNFYQGENQSLRLLANIGFGAMWFFDGDYAVDEISQSKLDSGEQESGVQFLSFFDVGARWNFAKRHALELLYRHGLSDMFASDSANHVIQTTINRNSSISLRYVFEFGD